MNPYKVIIDLEARGDIRAMIDYYKRISPNILIKLEEDITFAMTQLEVFPNAHTQAIKQTRRVILRRFPYSLHYRVEEDRVVVLACIMDRINPITKENIILQRRT